MLPPRLGCSTISFQHLPLAEALDEIVALGFTQIDLGALPGVCDHVPAELDERAIDEVAETIRRSGLLVRSVNGDVGDFNLAELDAAARRDRDERLERLLALTQRVGAAALVLPCGSLGHDPIDTLDTDLDRVAAELLAAEQRASAHGVAVWVESLHYLRLCFDKRRADLLHERLSGSTVRPILDLAHVVAAGDDAVELIGDWAGRIAHVHVRDAVAGNFNAPFGTGDVDFAAAVAALDAVGFTGSYALELPGAAYDDSATNALDGAARRAKTELVSRAAAVMTDALAPLPHAAHQQGAQQHQQGAQQETQQGAQIPPHSPRAHHTT